MLALVQAHVLSTPTTDRELAYVAAMFAMAGCDDLARSMAHRVAAVMQALERADPRIVQALAAVDMQPGQLIAQAFGGIAERAERIGQLNVSPDLLQGLLAQAAREETGKAGRERGK